MIKKTFTILAIFFIFAFAEVYILKMVLDEKIVEMKQENRDFFVEKIKLQEDNFTEQIELLKKEQTESLQKAIVAIQEKSSIYNTGYIDDLINRVENIKDSELLNKGQKLFKDLMDKTELETYYYGLNHNVIEDSPKNDQEINTKKLSEELIKQLKEKGYSDDTINLLLKKQ